MGRWRMTGSAFTAMDVVYAKGEMRLKNGEEVWRRGGAISDRTGRWRIYLEVQNRAPMQVKLTFSEKYRFFGFQERRFTCMGAHLSTIIELPCK